MELSYICPLFFSLKIVESSLQLQSEFCNLRTKKAQKLSKNGLFSKNSVCSSQIADSTCKLAANLGSIRATGLFSVRTLTPYLTVGDVIASPSCVGDRMRVVLPWCFGVSTTERELA